MPDDREKDVKIRKGSAPGSGRPQKEAAKEEEKKECLPGGEELRKDLPEPESGAEDNAPQAGEENVLPSVESDEISALKSRIEELLSENRELLDGLVRLKADFENYRKRMLREQTRILETAGAETIKKLLPILDDFERALANSKTSGSSDAFGRGVEMVHEKLLDALRKEGLEEVCPEGEIFDPHHHEAMMVVERDDCPEGTIIEVVRKGYRYRGTLLRPAMVKVSCAVRDDGSAGAE